MDENSNSIDEMVIIHPFGDGDDEDDELLDYLQGHWFSNATQDKPQFFRSILPNLNLDNVHSIQLNVQWCDQGWGGRKSRLFIVRSINTPSMQRCLEEHDEFLYKSPVAMHELENLNVSISLVGNDNIDYKYSIWAYVGGTGGREIRIASLSIKYLAYTEKLTNQ